MWLHLWLALHFCWTALGCAILLRNAILKNTIASKMEMEGQREGLLNLPVTPEEEEAGGKTREGLTDGAGFPKR